MTYQMDKISEPYQINDEWCQTIWYKIDGYPVAVTIPMSVLSILTVKRI